MAAWGNAEEAGELRVEHRLRAADGTYRWFATRALPERRGRPPVPDEDGPPGAAARTARPMWYGTSTDVEDARRAEAALRESEARFRGFAETSPDVLWIVDAAGEKLEYLSPAYEQVWGQPRGAVLEDLRRWAGLLHPDDRQAVLDILPRVLRGERVEAEYRIRRASDGAVRWIRDTGFPIRDGAGRVRRVAGLAQDVTGQREAEQQQKLLLNELNHRVKNALAGAQALAAQTARGGAASRNPGAFLRAFEERLIALARAHDMLTREGWRGASLGEVVRETLAPHGGTPGRVSASGPELRLGPGAAVALHMAFHELATNAAKYGALSALEGRVEVGWTVERVADDAPAVLDVAWREQGGPPVPGPPARPGFGTRFLERGLARQLGGEARFAFAPAGLEFHLRLPLSPRVTTAD
jgi:PAS domain S-box-containing protein